MKRLLLAGGGQAHVIVLRELARQRIADTEVVLVTPSERLIYSGMLPGWIAGHYDIDALTVALPPLAAAARARLLVARVTGLDLASRACTLDDGTPAHSFSTLLAELAGIVRNTCRTPNAAPQEPTFHVVTTPNTKQQRAFELLRKIEL